MTTTYPNDTVPWLAMLRWLDAQGGEVTLQRAFAVWGYKHVTDSAAKGDTSAPWARPGQPSTLRLTDSGRAKL